MKIFELHCNSRTYLPQEQWYSLSFLLIIEATIVVTCRPPGFIAGRPQCDKRVLIVVLASLPRGDMNKGAVSAHTHTPESTPEKSRVLQHTQVSQTMLLLL